MFEKSFGIAAVTAALSLAACGGGAAGGPGAGAYGGPPTTGGQANVPIQQNVAGGPAFENPSSNMTLYFLSVDTPAGAKCTGGCLSVWLPIVPSSGSHAQDGFTIVARSDGTSKQWDYKNHPLYMYAGDSGPDQAHGEGIPFAGGTWHVARSK